MAVSRGGIIPAGAGKSPLGHTRDSPRRDHPRGCGEKKEREEAARRVRGSSPRVRGKVQGIASATRQVGIIPAGAGKSAQSNCRRRRRRDHPRGCGEKL